MSTKRGILFELQVGLGNDIDRPFSEMERRVTALQGRMNALQLGIRTPATAGAGSLGASNGATSTTRNLQTAEEAERRSRKLRDQQRRDEDERQRQRDEKNAERTQRLNRESLERQTRDLKKAEAERQRIQERLQKLGVTPDVAEHVSRQGKLEATAFEREHRDEQQQRQSAQRMADKFEREAAQQQKREDQQRQRERSQLGRQNDKDTRDYLRREQQEQQRASRESELALARQREAYGRLNESIGATIDGVTRLGEGMAYLGLIGEKDLRGLTDSLLRIRGTVEAIRGGFQLASHAGGLVRNLQTSGGAGGGVARGLFGLGSATGAGGAALGGTGLAIGGGITAAALTAIAAGAHVASDGRTTRNIFRAAGNAATWTSQAFSSVHRFGRTLGMDEHERRQFENQDLSMEDPNRPRYMGGPFGSEYNAAAAAQRNAERMEKLKAQQKERKNEKLENIAREEQFQEDLRRTDNAQRMLSIGERYRQRDYDIRSGTDVTRTGNLGLAKQEAEERRRVMEMERDALKRRYTNETGLDMDTRQEVAGKGVRNAAGQLHRISRDDEESFRQKRVALERDIYNEAAKRRDVARQELQMARERYNLGRNERGNFARMNPIEQQNILGIYRRAKAGQNVNEFELRALEGSGISRFGELAANQREQQSRAMFAARGGTTSEAEDIFGRGGYESQERRRLERERSAVGEEGYKEAYGGIRSGRRYSPDSDEQSQENFRKYEQDFAQRKPQVSATVNNQVAVNVEASGSLEDALVAAIKQPLDAFLKTQNQRIEAIVKDSLDRNRTQLAAVTSRINQQGRMLS